VDPIQNNETPEQAPAPQPPTPPAVPVLTGLTPEQLETFKQQVIQEAAEAGRRQAQSWTSKELEKERKRIETLISQADEPFEDPILKDAFGDDAQALRERRRAAAMAKAYVEQAPPASTVPDQSADDARTTRERWAAQQMLAAGLDQNDPEWNLLHPDGYPSQEAWVRAKDAAARLKIERNKPVNPTPVPVPVAPVTPAPPVPPAPAPPAPVIVDVTGGKGVTQPPLTMDVYSKQFDDAMEAGNTKLAREIAEKIRELATHG
jgi:hypothetical protein